MLFLCLNTNAVWLLDVTTNNRPHNTECEDKASSIANHCVTLVHATVEELQVLWQLVVDFQCCGDAEQHQETEIDH